MRIVIDAPFRRRYADAAKHVYCLRPCFLPADAGVNAKGLGDLMPGGEYRIELASHRRFYLYGLGYTHPEWGHGVNKGPLAVGYDECAVDEVTAYEPPYVHAQAFATARMTTPEGQVIEGVGAFESFGMGPHARLGFTELFAAP